MLARTPATRTVSGPIGSCAVSLAADFPSTAAAAGDASTGTGPAGDPAAGGVIAAAAKRGNGVVATSAA